MPMYEIKQVHVYRVIAEDETEALDVFLRCHRDYHPDLQDAGVAETSIREMSD